MSWFLNFYRSALGKKAIMAVTGIILFGWITAHLLGNLKLYMGAEHLNEYGEWLRTMGAPALPEAAALWLSRIVLIVAVWLHIQAATQLTLMNRRARSTGYTDRDYEAADYASRTMRWGGVLLIAFVVFHILHLTTGDTHPNFRPGDVYHNVVTGFQVVWVSLFYIVAQIALGLHLYHGLWSMFQSLGWNHPRFNAWRRTFATAFALIIAVGNILFPLSVLTGLVR
jgi:succinate dehydrogenase / fumarate reductase, cytochrome b subunit